MKIRPVGTELYHADGRTVTTWLIVTCCNSVKLSTNAVDEKDHNMQNFNNIGWRNIMLSMRFMLDALTGIERCPKKCRARLPCVSTYFKNSVKVLTVAVFQMACIRWKVLLVYRKYYCTFPRIRTMSCLLFISICMSSDWQCRRKGLCQQSGRGKDRRAADTWILCC
jgi:hypothetical protein